MSDAQEKIPSTSVDDTKSPAVGRTVSRAGFVFAIIIAAYFLDVIDACV